MCQAYSKRKIRMEKTDECRRIEKERDDRLLDVWLGRQDALEFLGMRFPTTTSSRPNMTGRWSGWSTSSPVRRY